MLFIIGFLLTLMATGISLLGIIVALIAATTLMLFGALLVFIIKLLPWLIIIIIIVWVYNYYNYNR
ncbi:envelope stress response protein PspG [Pantoea sp. Aalb]|uniref:envelope stress response protein PspG n=1 Tax=Pantoea sp. Aalb TaxID=2576762 RepID=UPI002103BD6C|nr:envelope stress response protein PspG [Pantoea sp. Aalb]